MLYGPGSPRKQRRASLLRQEDFLYVRGGCPTTTSPTRFHFFPKKLEMLFMPFLLTLARLLCAWLMGCFALVAAAAASAFVCSRSRVNATPRARPASQEKGKHQQHQRGGRRGGGEQTGHLYFLAYVQENHLLDYILLLPHQP